MPGSARVESSDGGPEEERKAEPATLVDVVRAAVDHAAPALGVVTGLEDPAISEDALAAAEASRRA